MALTASQVESLAAKLDTIDEVFGSERIVSNQEVVSMLRKKIIEKQAQGYTLDQIASVLKDGGFDTSSATLRTYLQRTKASDGIKPKRQKSTKQGTTNDAPTPQQHQAENPADANSTH